MSRDSLIERGRAAAEAGMVDACTSRRQTGTTYDDDTGHTVPTWTALYEGPCRLKETTATVRRSDVGEADVVLVQPQVHLPMDAALLQAGDEITITACPNDPLSVGRVFRVESKAGATARRYTVIERTS